MQKQAPTLGRLLVMVGLRAVVLRPAAVPVAGLRRPDPAQAEGLPLQRRRSARPPSWPRRPTSASPACRSARSSRSRRRPSGRSKAVIELDAALRAAAEGQQGDPAPEDAAGRDLRRADARPQVVRDAARERHAADLAGLADASSSTRSFARSTRRRATAFQTWMQTQAQGVTGRPRPGHQRRARQPRAVRRSTPTRCCSILNAQDGDVAPARQQHRRGLRRALPSATTSCAR